MNGTAKDWNLREYLKELRKERIKKYSLQSLIVSFDGMSGAGKDVQITRASGTLKNKYSGIRVIDFRESTLVKSPERISYLQSIIEGKEEDLDRTLDLYTQDRVKAWETHIIPAAKSEGIILLDRSSYTTFAIQSFLRNMNNRRVDKEELKSLVERLFPEPIVPPEKAIFTICEVKTAYERISERERRRTISRNEDTDPVHRYEREIYSRIMGTINVTDEAPTKWWLAGSKEAYRWLAKRIPDSVQVLTGRNTIRVNPVLFKAIDDAYYSLKK